MNSAIAAGSVLGFLAGLVAGSAVRNVTGAASGPRSRRPSARLVAQLLAIPAVSLGPPWLGARFGIGADPSLLLLSYAIALAATMLVVAGHSLAMLAAGIVPADDGS